MSDELADWATRDHVSDDDVRRRQLVWFFLRHENVGIEERHDIAEGKRIARMGSRYGHAAFVALVRYHQSMHRVMKLDVIVLSYTFIIKHYLWFDAMILID